MIDPAAPDYRDTPVVRSGRGFAYTSAEREQSPLISIVTVFDDKSADVLAETARCVAGQSFQQFEWIVVNYGTNDADSTVALASFKDGDGRVRVIDVATRSGSAVARNEGISAARTEFILLLDAGDLLEPTAAEKMHWYLRSHPEFAAVSTWAVHFGSEEGLDTGGFDYYAANLERDLIPDFVMIRRDALRRVGGFDTELSGGGEKWDLWLRLADAGMWGGTIHEYLGWHRRRAGQPVDEHHRGGAAQTALQQRMRVKHRELYARGLPEITPRVWASFETVSTTVAEENGLAHSGPRILLIIPWMTMGGADKFNLDLTEQLRARGWEVSIVATLNGGSPWAPAFIRHTPDVFILGDFLVGPDYPAFIASLIRSRQFDAVMVTGSQLGYLLTPYLRTVCPGPVYVELCHMEEPPHGGYARLGSGLRDQFELHLLTSEHLRGWMIGRGVSPERADVVYTNIDTQHWKPDAESRRQTRERLGLAAKDVVILYAARLSDQKQPLIMAEALRLVAAKGLAFTVLIAGDGPDHGKLEAFIAEHQLTSRVRLLGAQSPDRMRELMTASDIFFLPSQWEGIALTMYEAMSTGVAVLGCDVGGQRELVTPECGILVSPEPRATQAARHAEALERLIRDEVLRGKLARSARDRICQSFTIDKMTDAVLAGLDKARDLQQRAPRPRLSLVMAAEAATQVIELTRLGAVSDSLWREYGRLSDALRDLEYALERSKVNRGTMESRCDELQRVVDQRNATLAELHGWVQSLETRLTERVEHVDSLERELAECRVAVHELQTIHESTGWALLQRLYGLRFRMFPRESRRERLARRCMGTVRRVRHRLRMRSLEATLAAPPPSDSAAAVKCIAAAAGPFEKAGLVSVILPVYNQADLLRESIESVLAQTYPNFELIINNDGSTDAVNEVLREYLGHPRVRILTQPNQKLPKALSNAFEFATGEYWTWTSADNLMEPTHLEREVDFLRRNPELTMVYANYTAINDAGELLDDPTFRPHNRPTPRPDIFLPHDPRPLNTVEDNFIGPCFMYRAWAGRLIGEYAPEFGLEDYDYWMRMNRLFRIAHLDSDEPLYRYRVHGNTISAQAAELKIQQRVARLMEYERQRSAFYGQPYVVYADEPTQHWLANIDLGANTVRPFSEMSETPAEGEKNLVFVSAGSLARLPNQSQIKDTCTAAWLGDAASEAYACRATLERADVCFCPDSTTVARAGLFHSQVLQAGPGQVLFNLALAFANNRLFYGKTVRPEVRVRKLPEPLMPAEPPCVLVQVEHFAQGGLEQVVLDLLPVLVDRGFRPLLLVLGKCGAAADKARAAGFELVTLAARDREASYRRLLSERKVRLVNAHFCTFGARIAAGLQIPYVQTMHSCYVSISPEVAATYRDNDPFTAGYICTSSLVSMYSDLKLGLSPQKMVIIPNGIDPARLEISDRAAARSRVRSELGLSADDFVFLHVGSIYRDKGQDLMVKALAQVAKTRPQARLVLLGRAMDDAYLSDVRRLVGKLGLQKSVVFAGHHEQVAPYYAAADAFLLPSFWEGWSLALGEAVYMGLPAIATAVGSAPDLLPRVGGRLLAPVFKSIADVDVRTLGKYLFCDHSRLISDLAEAMRVTCNDPKPPAIDEQFRKSLESTHAYGLHARLFAWLLDGGDAITARCWTRAAGV